MRVVLGPGLAPGLAGIGVLMELEASGVDVVEVIGANSGALGAALWGIGSDLGLAGRVIEHLPWSTYCAARDLGDCDPLLNTLDVLLRRESAESLSRRVGIVLSDLEGAGVRLAREGSLARLVRGSMAVPGIIQPLAGPGGGLDADAGARWSDAVRDALDDAGPAGPGHPEMAATLWVMCLPAKAGPVAGTPPHFPDLAGIAAAYAGRNWPEPPRSEKRRLVFVCGAGGYLSFECASEWIAAGRSAARAWLEGKDPDRDR